MVTPPGKPLIEDSHKSNLQTASLRPPKDLDGPPMYKLRFHFLSLKKKGKKEKKGPTSTEAGGGGLLRGSQ